MHTTSVSRRRLVFVLIASASVLASVLVACASDETPSTGANNGDASADSSPTKKDGDTADEDTGGGNGGNQDSGAPKDGSGGGTSDADGPGEAGADCAFNRECNAALRCECNEATGCACKPGARGTGKNGIDQCDSGEQCASSVCVEGHPDNTFYCSDECMSETDCKTNLPKCLPTFGFPGSICVRM